MKKLLILLLTTIMIVLSACSLKGHNNLVLVEGGSFVNTNSNYYRKDETVQSFYIGKHEVTQKEWMELMENNPSNHQGDNLPVEKTSWYECIEYCNKRSIKEGFEPYYNIDKDTIDLTNVNEEDDIKWTVTINKGANGYRLPTEVEWEYAAGGGQMSRSYKYSGSNNVDEIGYYWQNSGDKYLTGIWHWSRIQNNNCKTHSVGSKKPNELELYDMSGNVREWCWDWYQSDAPYKNRVMRGGGWIGGDFCLGSSYRDGLKANARGRDLGLRVCRSKYPNDNQKSN